MNRIYKKTNTVSTPGIRSKPSLKIHRLLQEAVDLHQKGLFNEALPLYESVLAEDSKNSEALHLSGLIAYQTNNPAKGVKLMQDALKISPQNVACLVNLGLAEHVVGDFKSAEKRYKFAISIRRDFEKVHYNLGNLYKDQNIWDKAIQCYETAITLKPDYWEVYLNLANVLESNQLLENAIRSLNKVLFLSPFQSKAYNNRGNVYKKLEKWRDAINDYDLSIHLDKNYSDVYVNKGNLLKELGYWEPAIACYRRCLEIDKAHPKAIWNMSILSLTFGDFTKGWQEYETRWLKENEAALNLKVLKGLHINKGQEWRGLENISGKRILLYAEQGLGDSIQFVRFIPELLARGANVLLMVQRPLIELFKQFKHVSHLLATEDPIPNYDFCCPLMSLPLALELNKESDYVYSPYLHADENKTERWAKKLNCISGPKVGVVWRGSVVHANDRQRSLSFQTFKECLPSDHLFVSLQKEVSDEDLTVIKQNGNILDFSQDLTDFSETAALCANLDLIICVDTSVAHLAGAIGKEVWLLIPFIPDWRWMLGRQDSPWYANLSLYRQRVWGEWSNPLEQVKIDLVQKLSLKK